MAGITIDTQNLINQKALTKSDGIYVFRGIHYLVKNKEALYFLCGDGSVLANYGNFNVSLGKIEVPFGTNKKKFQELAKENKWL